MAMLSWFRTEETAYTASRSLFLRNKQKSSHEKAQGTKKILNFSNCNV